MTVGAGKYDDLCTIIRVQTNAEGVVLLILNGTKGGGFSVQAPEHAMPFLADFLEKAAAQIRKDMEGI